MRLKEELIAIAISLAIVAILLITLGALFSWTAALWVSLGIIGLLDLGCQIALTQIVMEDRNNGKTER